MQVQSLGQEDSLGEGMATQFSILAWRILMDREAWQATVHRVAKSQTGLKQLSTHTGGVVFSRILSLYYGIISVYNGFFFSKLFLLIDSIRLWSSQRKVEEFIN